MINKWLPERRLAQMRFANQLIQFVSVIIALFKDGEGVQLIVEQDTTLIIFSSSQFKVVPMNEEIPFIAVNLRADNGTWALDSWKYI